LADDLAVLIYQTEVNPLPMLILYRSIQNLPK
jgi:hypothetical protein